MAETALTWLDDGVQAAAAASSSIRLGAWPSAERPHVSNATPSHGIGHEATRSVASPHSRDW